MAKPAKYLAYSNHIEPVAAASYGSAAGPAVDLVHLSHQTLGDNALERELLSLFDRQAAQFAQRLAGAARPGESGWRADLAHSLKGSSRVIGAFEVGRAAEAYEDALRAGALDAALLWSRLETAITAARSAIAELLERP